MSNYSSENRLRELVADKVLFGLDQSQQEEMEKLFDSSDSTELQSFEFAAAIVDLSMLKPEHMPQSLELKLMRQGRAALGEAAGFNDEFEEPDSASDASDDLENNNELGKRSESRFANSGSTQLNQSRGSQRIREIVAWGCAAAIGFVALMVWSNDRNSLKDMQKELTALRLKKDLADGRSAELSLEIVRLEGQIVKWRMKSDELIAVNDTLKKKLNPDGRELYNDLVTLDGAIRWDWSPGNQPQTKATGEVLWDEKNQRGVMRLVNLKVNDPLTSQYQLWIIEENGRPHPVDGGLFDIEDDGEVFIPIDAKLFASRPELFAITEEEPKGVVVSNKVKLHLLAKANEAGK